MNLNQRHAGWGPSGAQVERACHPAATCSLWGAPATPSGHRGLSVVPLAAEGGAHPAPCGACAAGQAGGEREAWGRGEVGEAERLPGGPRKRESLEGSRVGEDFFRVFKEEVGPRKAICLYYGGVQGRINPGLLVECADGTSSDGAAWRTLS